MNEACHAASAQASGVSDPNPIYIAVSIKVSGADKGCFAGRAIALLIGACKATVEFKHLGKLILLEIVIGVLIGLSIIAVTFLFAFRTPKIKRLSRHGIRGNWDYADGDGPGNSGFDNGGDGGD